MASAFLYLRAYFCSPAYKAVLSPDIRRYIFVCLEASALVVYIVPVIVGISRHHFPLFIVKLYVIAISRWQFLIFYFTLKETARVIVQKAYGDYCLALKGNQRQAYEEIRN